jgi:DNA (cytosine-5)-methyltransferase 3A
VELNILSLFDGISCGRIALERANIKITKYFASEVDKYAIKVSKANYHDIVHIGDIKQVSWFGLPKIDLLIGGSPCQGFSFAGKQLNFDDPRSKLFFDYVRILNELQPRYFLLENVVMKKEYQDIISHHLGVEPIKINSALVSAQNRKRLYWTNIPDITQPKDKGILLKDIIEDGEIDRSKSLTLLARYAGATKRTYDKRMHQMVFNVANVNSSGRGQNGNVYHVSGKSPTITTNKGEGNKITGCIRIGTANIPGFDANKRVYSQEGKSNTLLSSGGGHREPKVAVDEIHWRKLTPIECERLQTVPDNYTAHVSNSQRYKMLGNAWTVDVIAHIFNFIKVANLAT